MVGQNFASFIFERREVSIPSLNVERVLVARNLGVKPAVRGSIPVRVV
jgi:hypothetical protein